MNAFPVIPADADEATLCALHDAFCEANRLPRESADELIHRTLTDAQRRWVTDFITRWEACMAEQEAKAIEDACRASPDASTLLHRQVTQRYGAADDIQRKNPSAAAYHCEQARQLLTLRDNLAELLDAAQRADGNERPNRPERAPGYSDAEWTAFLRGWDAHAEAVFASGLRAALARFIPED